MIPFHTTPEQVLNLAPIRIAMGNAGLAQGFIDRVSELAGMDQGVYDLMAMWFAGDFESRREILVDLQESLVDYEDFPAR